MVLFIQELIDGYSLPEYLYTKLKEMIDGDDMGVYSDLRLDSSKLIISKLDNTSILLEKYDPVEEEKKLALILSESLNE
jgi:hypothetical protein